MNPTDNKIHIWIFNHPFAGIGDQLDFFIMAMKQRGYHVTLGKQPRVNSLNVLIENFAQESFETVRDFCEKNNKKVAVIMTEHLDLISNTMRIHGEPLFNLNDYMHPHTQIARIRFLFDLAPYIECLLTLGDLPKLQNINQMLPGIAMRRIFFPAINPPEGSLTEDQFNGDLLFTGFKTHFREEVIDSITAAGMKMYSPEKMVSRHVRNKLNSRVKIILNLPQRKSWEWLSLMRIFAGLYCGRATVSLGTNDNSEIAACCYQLDIDNSDWVDQLKDYVENYRYYYETALNNYNIMAEKFEKEHPFPHDIFELWGITDNLPG
ncbi:hypothetical protein P0136_00170 [Lentisphaerota bacterium ZTH]|nr:hypothetical protein JYG24_08685 [Lentisphaerota bacterium]WET06431.1 hypothetical protein P0136_00170 [Lentisphaerota bacterium ZTH]